MWCPKCKTEYRDGIAVCAECHTPLVEALPAEIDISPVAEKLDTLKRIDSRENLHALSDGNNAYVEKGTKYEDMKSTAGSFLLVGAAGLVLLALIFAGVIPLQFAAHMKGLMGIVMGGMFVLFLVIGIRSFQKLDALKAQVLKEAQDVDAAKSWFFENCTAASIDRAANIPADENSAQDGDTENSAGGSRTEDSLQQNFFARSAQIKQMLQQQFPAYEDSFLDYLTEQFYEELYPQDE